MRGWFWKWWNHSAPSHFVEAPDRSGFNQSLIFSPIIATAVVPQTPAATKIHQSRRFSPFLLRQRKTEGGVFVFLSDLLIALLINSNKPFFCALQVAQSQVWWWLMCGATCLFWTTGIWCPGWPWLAVGTTAWCTTASCTRSADWAYRGTWTTWRGKSHAKHLCRGCRVRAWSARSVGGCWAVQFEQINIHTAQQNMADGVACSSAVQHIAKGVRQVS